MCCHIYIGLISSVYHMHMVWMILNHPQLTISILSICPIILVKSGHTLEGCGCYVWIVTPAQGQGVHTTYGLSHICGPIQNDYDMQMVWMILTYPQRTISILFCSSISG